MAIGVEQSEIVEPVGAAVHLPDDVMEVPVSLDGNKLAAQRASALLLQPEFPESALKNLPRLLLLAQLEVGFPFGVEGIGFRSDLDVYSFMHIDQIQQTYPSAFPFLALRRCREDPSPMTKALEVLFGYPRSGLVWMAASRPPPQS